ncbi:FUSC family protein [Streptomyces sp. bgisy154]|uniref:FUSC family protein n=1 Tax=Streptomyces sp. bgisy154 TaxID=3413794 RepID=UPI003D7193CE
MSRATPALPPWLAHALHTQRGPVPWSAVVRGASAGGPSLMLAMAVGHTSLGVIAAVAAMLAGINDRPGGRRAAVRRIGVPALAGAAGLLAGTYAGDRLGAVPLTLHLAVLGLLAGAVSAVGPIASASGTQLLVMAAVGAGMPLPEGGEARPLAYLAGAVWLLTLRLMLPTPRSGPGDFRFAEERTAVAQVYDAVAALLDAVGSPQATARRAALTAALDHAQDALGGPRLRRRGGSAAERRLHARYAAALPLAEAATALAWAGAALAGRIAEGSRRLAAAVRADAPAGPLPAPLRDTPGLRALDDALLHAADAFDRGNVGRLRHRRRTARELLRAASGAGGREYGVRVALCFGCAAGAAQALHHTHWYGQHTHWYWLPVTAVFLVKPDLGPLVSRVLCRAAGTVLGALLFAGLAAVLPRPEGLVALVVVSGALIPLATRHFAAQTAVVTVLVLALVMVGGEPQAALGRIGETLLACVIVLVAGHLPLPGGRGGRVRARLTTAVAAADAYLAHVLAGAAEHCAGGAYRALTGPPDDRAARWALRREAYRTLAEARTAIAVAAAELPSLARHTDGTDQVAALLERLVDTTTAYAVHLDDTGWPAPPYAERIGTLLTELARRGRVLPTVRPGGGALPPGPSPRSGQHAPAPLPACERAALR